MSERLDDAGRDLLFREARSYTKFLDKPVDQSLLRELYDILKMGPTSGNCCPARIIFLTSPEAKAPLMPGILKANIDKVRSAPVTAIIGHKLRFFEDYPHLYPNHPLAPKFEADAEAAEEESFRNGVLQGAYLIMAARAVGLDIGAISGIYKAKIDAAFFAGTSVRTNFLCNLGYGDPSTVPPRRPRFDFDEACRII